MKEQQLPFLTPKQERQWERIYARLAEFQHESGMSREEMKNYFGLIAMQKIAEALKLQGEEGPPSTPVTPALSMDDFNGWDQVAKQLFPDRKRRM